MGTQIDRRRLMGKGEQYTERDYIQNGLIFLLDGINKGNNDGYWTDLIGGCTFTIPEPEKVEVLSNGFKFYESANMPLASGTLAASGVGKTIEVVCQRINYHANGPSVFSTALGSAAGNVLVHVDVGNPSNVIFLLRTKRMKVNFPWDRNVDGKQATGIGRFSYNTDVACFNGTEAEFDDWSNYWTSYGAGVGYGRHAFYGKVFAIRIYDRHLTLEEMQYNQHIDSKRFRV